MAQKPQTNRAPKPATNEAAGVQNEDAGGIFVDQQDATDLAPQSFAEGNPTGFLENMRATFDSTLRSGLMVSKERSRSIAYEPIMAAINQGVESSQQLTNPWLGASRGNGGGRIRQRAGTLGVDLSGPWAGVTIEEQEAAVWAEIGRRRKADPGFLPGIPRTREELNAKVDEADRKELEADEDVNRRATLWGSAGGFIGGVGGAFRDPINILTLPLGAGGAKTVLGAAIREGGINAAITGIAQPQIATRNRELGREYGLDEAVTSTLYGGIGGVVLGGGAKGLQRGAEKLGRRIARSKMHEITAIAESGNRDFNDRGQVVTSPAGAKGRMQVLDSTAADPGFGIKPARDGSLAERARVGRDVLDAMMKRYSNDPRKAWAAYNWGPGNLDKAIARYGNAWLEHAPAETKKYVRKNIAALGMEYGQGANWLGPVDADPVFPPATADQVSAAITLEGLDEIGRTSPLPATAAGEARHIETLQAHIDALEVDAPRPELRVEPIELKTPEEVRLDRYDPRELVVDPTRFQFKDGGDADGVLDTLRGVREWNPILSGKAVVWVDEAGKPHVADGHQRVGLARRLIGETPGADIRIDAVTLRAEDGISAEMARTWAALKNVAEGSGSPIDAAKVLRATGDSTPIPLPPRSALVRDARSLASLSDDAFGMVVNEIVPPHYAALVGRLAPGAPELHAAYLQLLHRLEPATLTQADSIVRQAIAAGATRETQLGLFGEEIVSRSLYLERARVLDNSLRRLKNDKRIFRTLIEARDDIEGAGNVLATDANAAKVENNAQALEILTRLAHRTGPVSDALGRAAGELAAGRSAKAAVDRFIAELDALDLSELARGVERSPGDGDAVGGPRRAAGSGEPAGAMGGEPAPGDAAGAAGGADDGLGEQIGTDLFGNPVYAERSDAAGELDGPAVLEAAVDDAQEASQLEGFSAPHGSAAAARQTELLEHDVRLDAEKARQAAGEGQGAAAKDIEARTTRITREELTDAPSDPGGPREFDMGEAGRRLRAAADEALERGASVTLAIGDREIPIVAAGMVDEAGQRWGAMPIVAPERGGRAELVIVERQIEADRPSSQDSAAGDRNGSGPRSSSESAGSESVDGSTRQGVQPEARADSARTPPAGEEQTSVGLPQYRTKEAIMSPPDGRAGTPADAPRLFPDGERVNPQAASRAAETAQLAANAPLRSVEEQADVDGLALFDQVRSPELFAFSDRLDADRGAVPELRTADDLLAELDAEDAAIAAIERCLI